MVTKVETCQDMGIGTGTVDTKYLFFGDELHVGKSRYEEHIDILGESGREITQVLVAGGLTVFKRGDEIRNIIIDGEGSTGLQIERRDPSPVVDFIKSFLDAGGKSITSI